MTPVIRLFLVLCLVAAAAGCGVRASTVPRLGSAFASPSPTPGVGGTTLAATALQNVETTYQHLPHTSVLADLNALATSMVSSGAFKTATVVPGGISATLSNGAPVLVFADRVENLGVASLRRGATSAVRRTNSLGASNAHEVAFLVNTIPQPAFTPSRQQAFADAFSAAFLSASGYAADDLDVTLDNIVALGAGHPVDFLDIATHGIIGGASPNIFYYWLSTTPDNAVTEQTYSADISAGRVESAIALTLAQGQAAFPATLAFTPDFLTSRVTFNPGAIVDNESCYGQSPLVAVTVRGILQAAGVGRYLGWTKQVSGSDADETDAFIFDRLLGEQSPSFTGLDAYILPFTPPQRPFPLDQIQTVLASETRDSKIEAAQNESYLVSDKAIPANLIAPPIGDKTAAKMIITDLGGENVSNPPIEYGLPSIAQLQVDENPTNGTLTILGAFPAAQGTVQITDTGGTHPLPITSWATDHVVVTVPGGGAGSAGAVQVLSSGGIESNSVPLTQWSGQFIYTENDAIPDLSGQAGSGSGTVRAAYTVTFRSDVHPTVTTIDTSPLTQNLSFNGPQAISSAAVTAFTGTFTTADGMYTATFTTSPQAPPLTPGVQPLPPSTFDIGAVPGQPAPCNNSLPGPQGGASNVFCPGSGFISLNVGSCTDNDSGQLCPGTTFSPQVKFGFPTSGEGGLLVLTMDPSSYAITVAPASASFVSGHFGGSGRASTASMTGTVGAPAFAPTNATPAYIRRRAR